MKAILEKMWDESAHIERVILIAGAIASGDAFADDLNDFFDEEDKKTIEKCLGKIPDYVDLESRGYERADGIYEWLRDGGKLGLLVKFATPVMEVTGENSRSFSWGYYNTTWVYAETIGEAVELGMKWVNERRRAEDRKAKSKKGGAA